MLRAKIEPFSDFRRFRLNLGKIIASSECATEKIRVFYRGNNILRHNFQIPGEHSHPPADAHAINQSTFDPCYTLVLGVFRTMLISVSFI